MLIRIDFNLIQEWKIFLSKYLFNFFSFFFQILKKHSLIIILKFLVKYACILSDYFFPFPVFPSGLAAGLALASAAGLALASAAGLALASVGLALASAAGLALASAAGLALASAAGGFPLASAAGVFPLASGAGGFPLASNTGLPSFAPAACFASSLASSSFAFFSSFDSKFFGTLFLKPRSLSFLSSGYIFVITPAAIVFALSRIANF